MECRTVGGDVFNRGQVGGEADRRKDSKGNEEDLDSINKPALFRSKLTGLGHDLAHSCPVWRFRSLSPPFLLQKRHFYSLKMF